MAGEIGLAIFPGYRARLERYPAQRPASPTTDAPAQLVFPVLLPGFGMDGNYFLNGRRMEDESPLVSNAFELLLQLERADWVSDISDFWNWDITPGRSFLVGGIPNLVRLNRHA
jgi:hypothetical protein